MLEDLVNRVTEIGGTLLPEKKTQNSGSLPDKCRQLLSNSGEATGLARSKEILSLYSGLTFEEKVTFFETICEEFGVNTEVMEAAFHTWEQDKTLDNARRLHFKSEPQSQELIRRLNLAPGGTPALVAMREDLLKATRLNAKLKTLDNDFRHLFSSWFNRGFLTLESINWSTPADILEIFIQYEAVHEIQGWEDLRNRVGDQDRRLYAFFHPALVNDPLIFVEVALVEELPKSIGNILSDTREKADPHKATTAIFYSISNCQTGLRGISFGSFLIKQVAEQLQRQHPNVKRFLTLSPVPSLTKWAKGNEELAPELKDLITEIEEVTEEPSEHFKVYTQKRMSKLAAEYLLNAKHSSGTPFDPVSKFHLGNGAHLERIHLWADNSSQGLNNSWGVMVNYEYKLNDIEKNHEAFLTENKIVCSANVRQLINN
jgi:malonyl-CoA decarboxylase